MAFPFKTGGDFYNCEALNMRLHNHSADLNEYGTGTIYFNTGSNTNHSKHAVVHDGTKFKALAFVDEIATNAEFVELKEKVDLLIGDDVDTDTIIDSWKEVEAFLAGMKDTENLMDLLNSKLDKSGGTIEGGMGVLNIKRNVANFSSISFENTSGLMGYLGFYRVDQPAVRMSDNTTTHLLLHSGNIGDYKAGGLQTSAGADAVTIDANKNAIFESNIYLRNEKPIYMKDKGGNYRVAIFLAAENILWAGYNNGADVESRIAGSKVALCYGAYRTQGLILNSSGNVTIGESDLAETSYKLYVDGKLRLPYLYFYGNNIYSDTDGLYIQSYGAGIVNINQLGTNTIINNIGGNVLIGTTNEIKSGAKLQIKGDVYVDGNIIATKEVAAGGAGQEGASGDGGAEVIDKELAKGQSSYTIPNTIGRSAVAVSLYEWNANNSSWDMCLADISVKDATITVTFGSATSVNHKLVAVG